MKNNTLLLPILVLLSLGLAACGPNKESNFPTGKFVRSDNENHGHIFNADGTWTVFDGDFTIVNATYSVDGEVFTEESNDAGCPDVPKRFKYTFDGTSLTLNYIDDPADGPCLGRRSDFDNVTYILAEYH